VSDKIHVFDTTLRDGEQSAGVAFTADEKLEIALALADLGVDVIEAGFPCSTRGDLRAVQRIAAQVRGPTICALARAVPDDVDLAWEAVRRAERPRIHVFINTSDIQMAHQLRKGREQVLEQAAAMVTRAAGHTPDVEFSPMDATRADPEFLWAVVERCIDAGATTINVPDSVGYATPEEIDRIFRGIREHVREVERARLSFHGHDDLGLCTANTLAAVRAGARQVEVAVNGLGERAGNTALEEVVMALRTRGDLFGVHTTVDTRKLWPTSRLVERLSGMPVQPNKAIVGQNAFRHGSGIHQDGILKLRETWEIMDPGDVGIPEGSQLVLGKLSGRHAFRRRLSELGHEIDDAALERAFATFKALADEKIDLDDRGLSALVRGQSTGDAA
jgi:2-isopropylmalate synthase